MSRYNEDWREISWIAKRVAGFRCSNCGATYPDRGKGRLITHHKDFGKKNDLNTNLEVLCKWCHRRLHRRYRRPTFSYGGVK